MELDNKIAVITGASSGLGYSLATALVNKGIHVYGLARNKKVLDELALELGNRFTAVPMDITIENNISNWISTTFNEQHSPDILINNAGVGSFQPIDETTSDIWQTMIRTNLDGMYNLTSHLVPYMKNKLHSTHIINIGSILGKIGRANSAAYSTTKFGIQGFSESLFHELRHDHIKVTCVNPGSIETEFFSSSGIKSHDHMLSPSAIADTIIHVLETPDNYLISDLTIRPLIPKPAD